MYLFSASGHRASFTQMSAVAQNEDFGGNIPVTTLYRWQRKERDADAKLWDVIWKDFPKYLTKVEKANNYVTLVVDPKTNKFRRAIVVSYAAAAIIERCGRKITAADMAHSKHHLFGGMLAIGAYQLGSGKNIDLWCCITIGQEDSDNWLWIANELKLAKVDHLLGRGWTLILFRTTTPLKHFSTSFKGMKVIFTFIFILFYYYY